MKAIKEIKHQMNHKRKEENKKFWGKLIAYLSPTFLDMLPSNDKGIVTEPFPSNDRGIFTEPLPSNDMGIFTEPLPGNDKGTFTEPLPSNDR
jgi:hypothetical protein